ncbi:MAG: NADH-quinone oxidoreductase subunit J [Ignavibacteria bacterium]|nr:NADH-quinone oxidoreductase subunit J [Ignavibacteria bacterium]
MSLVAHFFMLTGLYLTMQAQFVAAVQVLVYAGAIMVLVVFVIMLLNVGKEQPHRSGSLRTTLGSLMALVLAVMIGIAVIARPTGKMDLSPKALEIGTTEAIGQSLFTTYLFPFEAVSLLLLAALIGSVILAKRHVKEG